MRNPRSNPFEFDVSRETFEKLEVFVALLEKWNPRINLVSRNSLQDVWTRHIADSIQVFRCTEQKKTWADLGSGGGFPGMVAAIVAHEEWPDAEFTLVESDQRKAAFLRSAARETGIACVVLADRIESVAPLNSDVLSARALADLTTLLGFAERHLAKTGTALFQKGVTWKKELEAAQEEWSFQYDTINSQTEPGSVILKVKGISRV
jgi:16S rRNA (guanine527-N7)-methyltransferase